MAMRTSRADSRRMLGTMSEQEPAGAEQARERGRFVKGVSGNREGARVRGRRFAELYDGICADLGGETRLTTLQRAALRQGCRLLVRAEKTTDPDLQVRLSNASARLLSAAQHGGTAPRSPAPKPPAPSLDHHLEGGA
jgi:hypothetical protein